MRFESRTLRSRSDVRSKPGVRTIATLRFALSLTVCLAVSACGAWKPEKFEADVAERIDSRLDVGMSVDEFLGVFPDAMRVDETGPVYVVAFQEPCFWCRSGASFRSSRETWSRVVTFEDGRLKDISPAVR